MRPPGTLLREGKLYYVWCYAYMREQARDKALRLREQGWTARVIPYAHGWKIYRGPRRQKR